MHMSYMPGTVPQPVQMTAASPTPSPPDTTTGSTVGAAPHPGVKWGGVPKPPNTPYSCVYK